MIGTSSVRRQSQLLHRRPDLNVVMFRGNVQTRLRKLAEGEAAATLLALAGLRRMELDPPGSVAIDTEVMVPAAARESSA